MNDTLQLPIDITQIQELIPHRYPFLLVDRVVELDVETKQIVCQKNVSYNEPYFQGHFPGRPIMPGVLIIEALAQAGGVMTQLTLGVTRSPSCSTWSRSKTPVSTSRWFPATCSCCMCR